MSTCYSTQNSSIKNSQAWRRVGITHLARLPGHFFQTLSRKFLRRRQQKIDRDAFLTMLSLDDDLLNDIGVSRGDLTWAANLPLSVDAATALRDSMGGMR